MIVPAASMEFSILDLQNLPEEEKIAEADRLAVQEAEIRFDLSRAPLIRAKVLKLAQQDHVLLVTIHHIVSDGWSIGIISDELGKFYEFHEQGGNLALPPLPIQYADFALWQENWLKKAGLEQQLAYWKRQLANLTQLEIPTDRPRPALQTHNGMIDSLVLPRKLTDALRNYSTREGCTMFMTCLAALKVLLHRYSGQTDVCVGSLVAGRNRVETERLIGLFVNPIVLRTDLSGDPAFSEFLPRVRETVIGAMANQDLPFQRIVEELRMKRDPSRHPVFQVNFIYQRDFVRSIDFCGIQLSAIPSKSPGSIYDLNFFMVERPDGWRASCEYNTDLFDASTIQRMLKQFQALLEGLATDPHRSISALPLISEKEQYRWFLSPSSSSTSAKRAAVEDGNGRMPVAPRTETEKRLATIWASVLDVPNIGVMDDFFELGGHSLLAGKLLSRIEHAFGKRLPLAELLQSPTIERLALRLADDDVSIEPKLVSIIQPKGSKPPFIVIGSVEYRSLTRELGQDHPIIGLTVPTVLETPSPHRLETIAGQFVDTLLRARPRGPYILGGYCWQGTLVYEMAQVLRAKGYPVALVVLFDTPNINYVRKFRRLRAKPLRLYFFAQEIVHHLQQIWRLGASGATAYIGRSVSAAALRWRLAAQSMWYNVRMNLPGPPPQQHGPIVLHHAIEAYQPKNYTGPVVLFRSAALQTGRFHDPTLGWGEFAGPGLEVYEIPGTHQELMQQPNAAIIAGHLKRCFAKACQSYAVM